MQRSTVGLAVSVASAFLALAAFGGSAEARPGALAVVIGNSDYAGDTPDVPFAVKDADAFADWFEEIGLETRRILRRENLTGAQMRALFGSVEEPGLIARLAETGIEEVFVFYSGHGAPRIRPDGGAEGYLLPVDVAPATPQFGGYALVELTEVMETLPVKRVTMFLDACFSGLSQGGALVPNTSASFGVTVTAPLAAQSPGARVAALTATAYDEAQFAHWLEAEEQGAFTAYALRGLRGSADAGASGNGDGFVSLPEVHDFLRREMTFDILMAYGRNQTPSLTGDSADLVFATTPPPVIAGSEPEFVAEPEPQPAPEAAKAAPFAAEEVSAPVPQVPYRCDLMAAHPYDPEAIAPGVELTRITADAAVPVCRSALEGQPQSPRFAFQLGRALAAREDAEALDWLRLAAQADYLAAWALLGELELEGRLGPANPEEGLRWLSQAAEAGHPRAMRLLGTAYRDGVGTSADPHLANEWYARARAGFEALAAQGSAAAHNQLGFMSENGLGVPVDFAAALASYLKAAEAGHGGGARNAGNFLRRGQGAPADYARARRLFEQAAAKGSVIAITDLGLLHELGQGVPADDALALDHYLRAAAYGHAWGARNAGNLLRRGRGAPADYARARTLFEQAAADGNIAAITDLGLLYEFGQGVPQDYARALAYYREAAAKGHDWGAQNAAQLLRRGRGAPRDLDEAHRLFEVAAEAGNGRAMNWLGIMHAKGEGVPVDKSAAVYWYRRAAEAGEAWGMNNLGLFYRNGTGLPRDYAAAHEWFGKAAEAGNGTAMNWLGIMHEKGEGVPKDVPEAVVWYRRAAEAGNGSGARNLGLFLARGRGVARDDVAAAEWYGAALKRGNKSAREDLTKRARSYGRVFWRKMQGILAEAGHYSGAIDGLPGSGTRRAVEAMFAAAD
ncbi:MAG: caspase family protein [Pikeienuella sp.]